MNVDFSGGLAPLDPGGTPSAIATGSSIDPFSTSFGDDAISVSPLAHFGDVVQQIGRSMSTDPAATGSDGTAHAKSMSDALDMLESVVGLMSLYGSNDEMADRLATGDLPKLERM